MKCSDCGEKHTDIIDYKRLIKYTNKTHLNNSIQYEKKKLKIAREDEIEKEQNRCPGCESKEFTLTKKGFSAGKAIAGGVIAGPIGLVGGLVGSNKVIFICNQCGSLNN